MIEQSQLAEEHTTARIFITGSTDGLSLAAARTSVEEGHQIVLHARSQQRTSALTDLGSRSLGVVVGDLGSAAETRSVAHCVNAIARMDAGIHNAGIYSTTSRVAALEGHASILAVNTLAPYTLTALIERPGRVIYLTSMQRAERAPCATLTG
jgi:NAD(P)-dependent dehydrogenase (short-subunit alcohol dehydrogenase family)